MLINVTLFTKITRYANYTLSQTKKVLNVICYMALFVGFFLHEMLQFTSVSHLQCFLSLNFSFSLNEATLT